MRIAFTCDNHIGLRFNYLIDNDTGISKRSLDFVNAAAEVVDKAVKERCDVIIIAGDFYEHLQVGPTIRKLVRERIISPIVDNGIKLVIIGGNHDSPQSFHKGAPYEDFSVIPGTIIARKPQNTVIQVDDEKLGLVLLPYLSPGQIVKVIEKSGGNISRENWLFTAQKFMKRYIAAGIDDLEKQNCNKKIIVGHFYISGSKIRDVKSPEFLPGEFEFKKEMLSLDRVDLAVFGHIHLHQSMNDKKIVVPGATERTDFGEIDDSKGFVIYDTESSNWRYVEINARKLVYLKLRVEDGDLSPTGSLMEKIPDDVENSVVRIDIEVSKPQRSLINLAVLDSKLKKAFYHEYRWILRDVIDQQDIIETFTLNPFSLFNEFIEKHIQDEELKEAILRKGTEILNSELKKVEE
ncbi:MAG: metallophosphoesterase family protein [Candidatus Hodarchaeales archaeon]